MTDKPYAQAWVPSTNGSMKLAVSCSGKDDSPSIILKANRRLGGYRSEENYVSKMLDFRFDGGEVVDTVAIIGDDMIGFENGEGKRFDRALLAGIASAKTLSIQTTDWQTNQIQETFGVSGANNAIKRVVEHCQTA